MFFKVADADIESKKIDAAMRSALNPKKAQEAALRLYDSLSNVKDYVVQFQEKSTDKEKMLLSMPANKEEFLRNYEKKWSEYAGVISKFCDFLHDFAPDQSNTLFATAVEASQFYMFVDYDIDEKQMKSWFDFLKRLQKNPCEIIGLSLATGDVAMQIIPAWALQVNQSTTVSLAAIDPIIETEYPDHLLKRLKAFNTPLNKDSRETWSKDKKHHIEISDILFPIFGAQNLGIIKLFYEKFKMVLEEKLAQGQKIVLGYHAAGTNIDPLLLKMYNELQSCEHAKNLILHIQGGGYPSLFFSGQKIDFLDYYKAKTRKETDNYISCDVIARYIPGLVVHETKPEKPLEFEDLPGVMVCEKGEVPTQVIEILNEKPAAPSPTTPRESYHGRG